MASGLFHDMEFVGVSIDDVVVCSKVLDEHVRHVVAVCDGIRAAGVRL